MIRYGTVLQAVSSLVLSAGMGFVFNAHHATPESRVYRANKLADNLTVDSSLAQPYDQACKDLSKDKSEYILETRTQGTVISSLGLVGLVSGTRRKGRERRSLG